MFRGNRERSVHLGARHHVLLVWRGSHLGYVYQAEPRFEPGQSYHPQADYLLKLFTTPQERPQR
jgi:hypothetical protein